MRKRLAVLLGLSPLLGAAPAQAEPFQVYGGGAFLGYAFGEGGGFEWGIEGFATRHLKHFSECDHISSRYGFGPLLRLSMVKASRLELTGAAHAGGELPESRPYLAMEGELGASLFLEKNKQPRAAPHTGVTLETLLLHLYHRQEWVTPAFSVGVGARWQPTFGLPVSCVEGRPYRAASGRSRRAGIRQGPGFHGRSPKALLWSQRATDECASVPAFLQLACELLDLEAPISLIARALRAAREEQQHTHAAAGLAELFGGGKVTLVPPPYQQRPRLPRPLALRRLVHETWLDGCLNEGLAAALAAAEAGETRDAEEARVSTGLAVDEAGHASLAFDVLRWALGEQPALSRGLHVPRAALRLKKEDSFLKPADQRELVHQSALIATRRLAELSA